MMHSADMTEERMCLEIDIYYIENLGFKLFSSQLV